MRLAPRATRDSGFTLEAVKRLLKDIGGFTDIDPRQHEGVLTCVFATAENKAVYDDMLTHIPWGGCGQRRRWPAWWVDRARPTVAQQRANQQLQVVKLRAVPDTGNRRRLEWVRVVRTLKKHTGRRYFARVRGGVHTTSSVELEVPSHHVGKLQTLFRSEVTVGDGDNKWRLEAH